MAARAHVRALCGRITFIGGLILILSLLAVPAPAATITVVEYSTNNVSITHNGESKTIGAGEFSITVTDEAYGLNDFETVAYCIQLDQSIGAGSHNMDLYPLNFTEQMEAQVAWLMNEYAPQFYGADSPDSQKGSGLQLAIWDVVYGDSFSVNSETNSTIMGYYNQYMAALATASPWPDLTNNTKFARTDGTQDLVVYNIQNVPVPASVLLLGSGLLALVGLARRRARAS